MVICTESDCGKPAVGRGFCHRHYEYRRRHGEFDTTPCTVPGCDVWQHSNSLCENHYRRSRRMGSVWRALRAQKPELDRCLSGDHLMTPENTYSYTQADGRQARQCRTCKAQRTNPAGDYRNGVPRRRGPRPSVCKRRGCRKEHYAKGLCRQHYKRKNARKKGPRDRAFRTQSVDAPVLSPSVRWCNADLHWLSVPYSEQHPCRSCLVIERIEAKEERGQLTDKDKSVLLMMLERHPPLRRV